MKREQAQSVRRETESAQRRPRVSPCGSLSAVPSAPGMAVAVFSAWRLPPLESGGFHIFSLAIFSPAFLAPPFDFLCRPSPKSRSSLLRWGKKTKPKPPQRRRMIRSSPKACGVPKDSGATAVRAQPPRYCRRSESRHSPTLSNRHWLALAISGVFGSLQRRRLRANRRRRSPQSYRAGRMTPPRRRKHEWCAPRC